ncbi:hypothetical protein DAPPUDRAFT_65035, partial [Daphnia pulex]
FEWDYLGRYFLSMVVQAIVFFSFTVLLHYQVLPESVGARKESEHLKLFARLRGVSQKHMDKAISTQLSNVNKIALIRKFFIVSSMKA